MKATFALLANREVYNLVRKIAWEANRVFDIGIEVARLEPYVSLKQSFEVVDFEALEVYMGDLAASVQPFEIHLTKLQAIPFSFGDQETGILWLDVEQSDTLRGLHHRVNHELEARFGPTPATHDGDEYHFHMKVAIGSKPFQIFQ
jgi:2'-5' RNA ligase